MLKKMGLALALCGAVVMLGGAGGGCQSSGVLGGVTANDRALAGATVVDDKLLYGAEAAFFGASTAAEAAVDNGLLVSGSPQALQVADGLAKAHSALQAARAAKAVGDAETFGARIAAAQGFAAAAWAVIPRKEEN